MGIYKYLTSFFQMNANAFLAQAAFN